MASDDRLSGGDLTPPQARPLADQLQAEGYGFEFYQAVALLERFRPDAAPLGETAEPEREAVRFSARVGLDFPASDIARIGRPEHAGAPVPMTVSFMGLAGHFGPLPDIVAEIILERGWRKDHAFRAFLDIFNHRLVSLLYRVRKKHRVVLSGRRPEETLVARCLLALIGLGTRGLRDRMRVTDRADPAFPGLPDRALLRWAGLLARRPRSMIGLQQVLAGHFGVPVEIRPYTGRWLDLPPALWTVIGGPAARNVRLGIDTIAGRRAWDQQGGFTVRLGPLTLKRFRDFLPGGGRALRAAVELIVFCAGPEDLAFDLVLRLLPAEVPACTVSARSGALLGWTSWLHTRPFTGPAPEIRIAAADRAGGSAAAAAAEGAA